MSQPTTARRSLRQRVADFFAFDDPWVRPGALTAQDWAVGGVAIVISVTLLELSRGIGTLNGVEAPRWVQILAVALGAGLLIGRRRWALAVAVLGAVHMFVLGITMPMVMAQFAMQVIYFAIFFSGVAWARSRRDMGVVVGGVVVFMFAWVAWQFAVGSGMDSLREEMAPKAAQSGGFLPLITSYVLTTAIVNVLYFGGAVIGGQVSWRAARQGARLGEQARTIADQTEELQRQAVLAERLRIARELHDVVAHHVSVIGIQAGASRRVLTTDPPAATAALSQVEASSREAVAQMRSLVGALRDPADGAPDGRDKRAPEPGLSDVAALVGEAETAGLSTAYETVEATPGALGELPGALGLAIYRIVQEALTNVRKHSTANHVGVVVRVDPTGDKPFAEVEVVDNGRPRPGTSGSGLGLLGVRERAAARRGLVEVGPRVGGGYRVRVRFPLEEREGAR